MGRVLPSRLVRCTGWRLHATASALLNACPAALSQFGKLILTTSAGMMDHEEARTKKSA